MDSLLSSIHNQFISDIKKSRASKINENNVFTGLFWTGTEALKIGLVDEIASIYDVNEKYFDTAELITYNKKDNLLNELMNANFKISLENSIHGIKY